MKQLIALAVAIGAAGAALAQPSVGVSIGINQPGVYGRINIGELPRPALVYPEPVVVLPPQRIVQRQPIYLYVPPVHQQNWRRYCNRYDACGQPVYFVQDHWVRERYAYEHPGWDRGPRHGPHRDWDRRDDRGFDHGPGHGPGRNPMYGPGPGPGFDRRDGPPMGR